MKIERSISKSLCAHCRPRMSLHTQALGLCHIDHFFFIKSCMMNAIHHQFCRLVATKRNISISYASGSGACLTRSNRCIFTYSFFFITLFINIIHGIFVDAQLIAISYQLLRRRHSSACIKYNESLAIANWTRKITLKLILCIFIPFAWPSMDGLNAKKCTHTRMHACIYS